MLFALLLASLGYGTQDCIGNPPIKYRQDVTVTVHFTTKAEVELECGEGAIACSDESNIWVHNPCRVKEVKDLTTIASDLCHEIGHVNGWPGNHPRH